MAVFCLVRRGAAHEPEYGNVGSFFLSILFLIIHNYFTVAGILGILFYNYFQIKLENMLLVYYYYCYLN